MHNGSCENGGRMLNEGKNTVHTIALVAYFKLQLKQIEPLYIEP